jgi:hypothetical protein
MLILASGNILFCLPSSGAGTFFRWSQLYAGATGLGQADGYRLLRRTRTVFPFPYMMDLFSNELAGLGRRRFALTGVFLGSLNRLFLGHRPPLDDVYAKYLISSSPQAIRRSL